MRQGRPRSAGLAVTTHDLAWRAASVRVILPPAAPSADLLAVKRSTDGRSADAARAARASAGTAIAVPAQSAVSIQHATLARVTARAQDSSFAPDAPARIRRANRATVARRPSPLIPMRAHRHSSRLARRVSS
ncbi:MAG TPA: hypothetical protein VMA83_10005 [Solirubrobacteraceae bacterium]|nr:hypothetical protein [Solirubrobacteraceae bacterium]